VLRSRLIENRRSLRDVRSDLEHSITAYTE
jgi:hypothetical protein